MAEMTEHQKRMLADLAVHQLAQEIARQASPTSVLAAATSPLETARALYLLGWQPPAEGRESHDPRVPQ